MQDTLLLNLDQETEQSILAWFHSLEVSNSPTLNSLSDLRSGYFLMDLLVEMYVLILILIVEAGKRDSTYFSKTKKRMVQYVEGNRVLIYKNLKTLAEDIIKYFSEILKIELGNERKEIFSFAKENDSALIINLIELTLYIILKSENSEKYIEPIIKMDELHQAALMKLIQRLLKEFEDGTTNTNELESFMRKEKKLLEKLDEIEIENMQLNNKITEMTEVLGGKEKKLNEIKEILNSKNNEINSLLKEKEKLQNQIELNHLDISRKSIETKEAKISEMSKYIEDLTLTYEKKISALEEDLHQERTYTNKLQKLEQSLEYYKAKFGDYSNLSETNRELVKINENLRNQIEELLKRHELDELKVGKYVEKLDQIQVEKLNLELEISKNNSELLRIKQEVSEFSEKAKKKDSKINELQTKLEDMISIQNQKTSFLDISPKNLKNELHGLVSEISEQPSFMNENINISNLEKFELQKDELLQKDKENKHLMEKCKELQNENSELSSKNDKLNDEIKRINNLHKNNVNELKKENKKLGEEILKLNEERFAIEEKMNNLCKNDEIIHELEEETKKLRNTINEKQKQISSLFEKNSSLEKINRKNSNFIKTEQQQKKEIENLKEYITNVEGRYRKALEKKQEEIELLISVMYDLRTQIGPALNLPINVLKDRNSNIYK